MRPRFTRPEEVAENIRRFAGEAAKSPRLRSRLGQVHSWYALSTSEGQWAFGPSKFVGYPNNTAAEYLRTYRKDADGGQTEQTLSTWFSPVDPESKLGTELMHALSEFLRELDRTPRRNVRISVVSEAEDRNAKLLREETGRLLSRISSDSAIVGGRPHIKGTRMRVSDIVDMLASGAAPEEILEDYPYLSKDDINAALAYAARAIDHRVIRVA